MTEVVNTIFFALCKRCVRTALMSSRLFYGFVRKPSGFKKQRVLQLPTDLFAPD